MKIIDHDVSQLEMKFKTSHGSKRRRALKGDLENILLKTLRKEPERRYASAEQLAEDIRRHLQGLPVTATPDSIPYRVNKFIRRHKIGMAAGAVILIAVLTGIVATVIEARIARVERTRAEKRFNDIRKLANSLIFGVHDSIQDLPGSTAARQIIIDDAVQYLDILASEAGNDVGLQQELASAYIKLGTVQGNDMTGNLGDTQGARRSYEKALSILLPLTLRDPSDITTQKNLASAYGMLGDVSFNHESAANYYAKALDIREKLAARQPDDARLWGELAKGYQQASTVQINQRDFKKAKELAQNSVDAAQRFRHAHPDGKEEMSLLSIAYTKLGISQENLGELEQALHSYDDAMEIDRELAAQSPDSGAMQRDISLDWQSLGRVKMARRDYIQALSDFVASIVILERLSTADPADKRTLYLLALAHEYAGLALLKNKKYESALTQYRDALNICRCRSQWDAHNAPPARLAGIVYKEMGDSYRGLADRSGLSRSQRTQHSRSACSNYVKSLTAFDHLRSTGSLSAWDENTRTEAAQHLSECRNSSAD